MTLDLLDCGDDDPIDEWGEIVEDEGDE